MAHLIASGLSDPLQGSQILRELAKRADSSAHIQVHVNEFANRVYCVHPSNLIQLPTTPQASEVSESPREAKFLFDPPLHFGCLEWHNFFGRRRRRRSAKPYIWKWPKCEYPGSGGRLKQDSSKVKQLELCECGPVRHLELV